MPFTTSSSHFEEPSRTQRDATVTRNDHIRRRKQNQDSRREIHGHLLVISEIMQIYKAGKVSKLIIASAELLATINTLHSENNRKKEKDESHGHAVHSSIPYYSHAVHIQISIHYVSHLIFLYPKMSMKPGKCGNTKTT